MVIKGRDQGEDGRAGIGGPVHVTDVDLVEGRFTDTKYKGTLLFQRDVGGAFDQLCRDSVGDARQSAHATWNNHHGVGGIGTAGHIGANVCIRLKFDLSRGLTAGKPQKAVDEIGSAFDRQFFSEDPKGPVRGNEIDDLDALVATYRQQKVAEKNSAARSCSSDRKVFGWLIGQGCLELRSIGT